MEKIIYEKWNKVKLKQKKNQGKKGEKNLTIFVVVLVDGNHKNKQLQQKQIVLDLFLKLNEKKW